jgi:hypothetical protein
MTGDDRSIPDGTMNVTAGRSNAYGNRNGRAIASIPKKDSVVRISANDYTDSFTGGSNIVYITLATSHGVVVELNVTRTEATAVRTPASIWIRSAVMPSNAGQSGLNGFAAEQGLRRSYCFSRRDYHIGDLARRRCGVPANSSRGWMSIRRTK